MKTEKIAQHAQETLNELTANLEETLKPGTPEFILQSHINHWRAEENKHRESLKTADEIARPWLLNRMAIAKQLADKNQRDLNLIK